MVRVSGVPYEVELVDLHIKEIKKAWCEGYSAGYKAALEQCEQGIYTSFAKLKENVA